MIYNGDFFLFNKAKFSFIFSFQLQKWASIKKVMLWKMYTHYIPVSVFCFSALMYVYFQTVTSHLG